jgi:[ribosomal protein S5]-alanine N-acetyltransferase
MTACIDLPHHRVADHEVETMTAVPTLDGPRVRLCAYRADDRDAMFRLYSDPHVARYWSFPAWTELAQADAYLAPLLEPLDDAPTAYPWAVASIEDDRLVGTTTLFAMRRDQARAEVGYSLSPAWQGRGYAREALRIALRFAFDTLALERIEADIDPRNDRSWRLLEGLGFRREGLLRARWRVNGEVCDSAFYGLLRAEYAPDRASV